MLKNSNPLRNSNKFIFLFAFFLFAFFIFPILSVHAKDLTSASFIVRDPVIGTGGGYSSSASFQLFDSQDKLFTGVGSSATFLGHYGFLYFAGGSAAPPPPPSSGSSLYGGSSACKIADLNCDGQVDIVDLSILLYYYNQPAPAFANYDLNKDGLVDLADISIMFYYWTA